MILEGLQLIGNILCLVFMAFCLVAVFTFPIGGIIAAIRDKNLWEGFIGFIFSAAFLGLAFFAEFVLRLFDFYT